MTDLTPEERRLVVEALRRDAEALDRQAIYFGDGDWSWHSDAARRGRTLASRMEGEP